MKIFKQIDELSKAYWGDSLWTGKWESILFPVKKKKGKEVDLMKSLACVWWSGKDGGMKLEKGF